jgi:hypothetical protein
VRALQPCGNFCLASSSVTVGTMMTSSPWRQLTGVATRWASVSWKESMTRRRISRSCVRGMHHPVEVRHLPVGVGDDREVRRLPLGRSDVLGPFRVRVHRIDGESDRLHPASIKLRLEPGHVPELGRADRREIAGMGEEDRQRLADPVVEAEGALRALGREVGAMSPRRSDIKPSCCGYLSLSR